MFFVWWIKYGFMKSPIVVQAKDEGEAWERLYREQETAWWVLQGEPIYKLKKFQTHVTRHKMILDATKRFCGDEAQKPMCFEKLPVLIPKEVY